MTTEPSAVGIIAGASRFPLMVADGAKRAGHRVVVVGLRGLADPKLRTMADAFRWAGVVRVGSWVRFLRGQGVTRAILAGSVRKDEMYGRFRTLRYLPDWTAIRIWFFQTPDKRNDSVLSALADHLQSRGITLENSVQYNADDLMPEGVLTSLQPSPGQWKDIEFGWKIAKQMGRLDIGQSIAVKEQEVIAVEAIEGTDRMIERAGQLCRHGGWTLVKVAKPEQDMRFDVPTVGPGTVENLKRHGAKVMVVEAGKAFVVDREKMIEAARRCGIVIVGRREPGERNEPTTPDADPRP
ncbi:MAG: UDP-2,3-diacylglucosamine diphosphatase LpxI [Phycisphaerales bacterium]|nr:MAG: UDP-2,3-diacylglucosamine diphosphatase LpxI [Phycisphaerales bacterium]